VSHGLVARLKAPLQQRADFSDVVVDPWIALPARDIAKRPVYLERDGQVLLGDLFDLQGEPGERIRFIGDLECADRLGAGLRRGRVIVEGNLGSEAGLAMAGGVLDIMGDTGPRAGAAPLGYKRGMIGGELIVRGSAGPEAGAAMRRGLIAIGGSAGEKTGFTMIAGTVIVFGAAAAETGLWSKRGSVIALGKITPPQTYAYACTYQPAFVRLMLIRLQLRYRLPVLDQHLTGLYRRYSGDLAELGRGEILEWIAN
jgi:formylmethanofuran dehydrogenase subunit C